MFINFTNGRGTGPATRFEVCFGQTLGNFFAIIFPEGNPVRYDITVNGVPRQATYELHEGDNVIFQLRDESNVGVAQQVAPVAPVRVIQVAYLNTLNGGFVAPSTVQEGTTYEDFIEERGVNPETSQVRVRSEGSSNSFNPTAGYVLRASDLVTVTPTNISGAFRRLIKWAFGR